MDVQKVLIKKLHDDAIIPIYGTHYSAGCDIFAISDGIIEPKTRSGLIPTGLAMCIPKGHYMKIHERSSLGHKYGIKAISGVIDSDYTNEIFIILYNSGDIPFVYKKGDRIAQFILMKYTNALFEIVDELKKTDRLGGFGSTGI